MEGKSWTQSKTILVGILTVVVAALTDPDVAAVVPLEWAPKLLALAGGAGILLRLVTGQPIKRG